MLLPGPAGGALLRGPVDAAEYLGPAFTELDVVVLRPWLATLTEVYVSADMVDDADDCDVLDAGGGRNAG